MRKTLVSRKNTVPYGRYIISVDFADTDTAVILSLIVVVLKTRTEVKDFLERS